MNNTNHTPGPWINDGRISKVNQTPLIKTSDNKIIAMIWSGNKADGKIIAAAPELLEVVKELYDWSIANNVRGTIFTKLEAAIKKAIG